MSGNASIPWKIEIMFASLDSQHLSPGRRPVVHQTQLNTIDGYPRFNNVYTA